MIECLFFRPEKGLGTWLEWIGVNTIEDLRKLIKNIDDRKVWCDVNGDGTRFESWHVWEWLRDEKRPK